jgi:hypothetical protein
LSSSHYKVLHRTTHVFGIAVVAAYANLELPLRDQGRASENATTLAMSDDEQCLTNDLGSWPASYFEDSELSPKLYATSRGASMIGHPIEAEKPQKYWTLKKS